MNANKPITRDENYGQLIAAPFSPLLKFLKMGKYRFVYNGGVRDRLEKKCANCGQWYEANTAFFCRIKMSRSWYTLQPNCRQCRYKINREA